MPFDTKCILFLLAVGLCRCDADVRFTSTHFNSPAPCVNCIKKEAEPPPTLTTAADVSTVDSPVDSTPTPIPTPTPTHAVVLSPYVNAVAFEDLYTKSKRPKHLPDYDYNDFLTDFKIREIANSENNITDIVIDFYPRAVGAGIDHIFYLVLNGIKKTPSKNRNTLPVTKPMFAGAARVTLSYFDAQGAQIGDSTETPFDQDIVVYPSTHAIFLEKNQHESISELSNLFSVFNTLGDNYRVSNRNARVHITLAQPELNPYRAEGFDPATFRVILHPIKTNYDIDIINVDATNFVSAEGYPWGFIIPTDWRWMKEGVQIDKGYPEFQQYRNFLMGRPATGDYLNWYKYPATDLAEKFLYPNIPWQETMPAE